MASRKNGPWVGHYLDHSILSLPRKSIPELESLIKLADWRVIIMNLSFLSTIESFHRLSGGESVDDIVANQFMVASIRDLVMPELADGAVVVNKFSLALIATVALRLGEEKAGEGKLPSPEILGEILLAANDVATEGGSGKSDINAVTIRHAGLSTGENAYCRLGRYYQLLIEIPDSMQDVPGSKNLREMFRDNMGFEINRLLALGFGLYSHYGALGATLNQRWRNMGDLPAPMPSEWILDSKSFLKNTQIPPQEAHQLMLSISTNPNRFSNEPTTVDLPFDFTHLKTWPMVHIGDTRFCVPALDALFDRLSVRAYFDIIDPLTTQGKNEFGSFFGKVVERYVHMILEEMLGKPSIVGNWFKPESYIRRKGSPEGPDAIIIEHTGGSLAAIFLEIKSSRPTRNAVISGDLNALRADWSQLLIGTEKEPKGARQLDRAINDFRAGNLAVPGVDSSRVDKIYPVIITLDPWPFLFEIYGEFLSDIADQNLLSGQNTEQLDVWSCFDLERLSPQMTTGLPLMSIVKQRPAGVNHIPLWTQISSGPRQPNPTSKLLTETWDRMRDNMVEDLKLIDPEEHS